MTTIGYIRVSTDKQDVSKQKHLLLEHAQRQRIVIDDFIEVEMSTRKSTAERRIDELLARLGEGDTLLTAELSRLGRNMLEVLTTIHRLSESGVAVEFVRQPELSTAGPHAKLLLAIYSAFAETERDLISMRTRQGLAAARANGAQLGRPKGRRNKRHVLDAQRDRILGHLQNGITLNNVAVLVNHHLEDDQPYHVYRYYVNRDPELAAAWRES